MNFSVTVGSGTPLGIWQSCSGLDVQFTTKELLSGGDYTYTQHMPDRITYSKVKLARAMAKISSGLVRDWLSQVKSAWVAGDGTQYDGQAGTILLYDDQNEEVARWELTGVIPTSWSGPSLTAANHGVAIETLELIHHGFLP